MALIALAAVAWGTGGAVAAVLYRTSGLGPIAVSYWRFVIGALALAVYLLIRRTRRRASLRRISTREVRIHDAHGGTGLDVTDGYAAFHGGTTPAAPGKTAVTNRGDAAVVERGDAASVGGGDAAVTDCGNAASADRGDAAVTNRGNAASAERDDAAGVGPAVSRGEAARLGTANARRAALRRRARRLLMVFATGVGLAVYQSAFYVSIAETGLAVATVVTLGAGPILIAIGARAFLAERLGHAGAVAITLALSGLIALSLDSGTTGPNPVLGIAFALFSALGYAVVTLVGRTTDSTGDPFRTSLTGFIVGGVVLTPFALAEGVLPSTTGLPVTLGWLLYLGVVASALAYGLFFAGLAHVSATTAAIVTLLEPVAAALLAVSFLGEHLTPAVLTGMLLLLGAVAALTRPSHRRAATASRAADATVSRDADTAVCRDADATVSRDADAAVS